VHGLLFSPSGVILEITPLASSSVSLPGMRTNVPLPLILIALATGCPSKTATAPPTPAYTKPAQPDGAPEALLPLPHFVDVAKAAGITFKHDNGATPSKLMPETCSGGACLVDLDGDGKLDIIFTNGRRVDRDAQPDDPPPLVAYRNLGGFKFEDVTEKMGFNALPRRHAMGVYAAHAVSSSGPPDLFVTAFDGALFLTWKDGKYVDRTKEAGLTPPTWKDDKGREHPAWSTAAAWFDADGDGKLDLLVGHYIQWTPEQDLLFTVDGKKIYSTPEGYSGLSPRLYRQKGDGTFEDATDALGFRNDKGKALGIALGDLAGDGRFAVAIANDTEPNNLYVRKGERYEDQGLVRGIAMDEQGKPRAGMGVDLAAELGPDTWTLAVGNFARESTALFRGLEKMAIDRAPGAGLAQPTRSVLTFGLAFLDLDRDGRLDLALANGHIEPTVSLKQKEISYEQRPQLFRARAGGKFEDVGAACGLDRSVVGRALALGDLDGNGSVDMVIAVNGGTPLVLRCDLPEGAGNVLRLDLTAKAPNPDAIGARVTVKVGDQVQVQSRRTGGSYLSQHEGTLTFGLGLAARADAVTIRWPDGKVQELGAQEKGLHAISEP
jgi:hypothetical protein